MRAATGTASPGTGVHPDNNSRIQLEIDRPFAAATTRLAWFYSDHDAAHGYFTLLSHDDASGNYFQLACDWDNTGASSDIIAFVPDGSGGFATLTVATIPTKQWWVFVLVNNGTAYDLWGGPFGGALTRYLTNITHYSSGPGQVYWLSDGFGIRSDAGWNLGPTREWSAALSQAEIEQEVTRAAPLRVSNLVYAHRNDSVAALGTDSSGNSNDAILVSGAVAAGVAQPAWSDLGGTAASPATGTGQAGARARAAGAPSASAASGSGSALTRARAGGAGAATKSTSAGQARVVDNTDRLGGNPVAAAATATGQARTRARAAGAAAAAPAQGAAQARARARAAGTGTASPGAGSGAARARSAGTGAGAATRATSAGAALTRARASGAAPGVAALAAGQGAARARAAGAGVASAPSGSGTLAELRFAGGAGTASAGLGSGSTLARVRATGAGAASAGSAVGAARSRLTGAGAGTASPASGAGAVAARLLAGGAGIAGAASGAGSADTYVPIAVPAPPARRLVADARRGTMLARHAVLVMRASAGTRRMRSVITMSDNTVLARFKKAPTEELDYDIEWILSGGDTISADTAPVWTVQNATLLGGARAPSVIDSKITKAWIGGGTSGVQAVVTVVAVTTQGRRLQRSFLIDVV